MTILYSYQIDRLHVSLSQNVALKSDNDKSTV